jgi:hypothetical protein
MKFGIGPFSRFKGQSCFFKIALQQLFETLPLQLCCDSEIKFFYGGFSIVG